MLGMDAEATVLIVWLLLLELIRCSTLLLGHEETCVLVDSTRENVRPHRGDWKFVCNGLGRIVNSGFFRYVGIKVVTDL